MSKSIFAARQKYVRGQMTKREFNGLVAAELFQEAYREMQTLPMWWRWLPHVGAYFELKRLGYE